MIEVIACKDEQVHLYDPQLSWNPHASFIEQSRVVSQPNKLLFENPHSSISPDNNRALLITLNPHFPKLSIDDASRFFGINDLCPALGDFFSNCLYTSRNGRRLSPFNCPLSFSSLDAWRSFRIQLRSTQNPSTFSPPQTIQAEPPSGSLPFGRRNTVLLSHETGDLLLTGANGERMCSPLYFHAYFHMLSGYLVAQVQAILQPITNPPCPPLLYVEFFNFSNTHFTVVDSIRVPAPASDLEMFVVQRRFRNNGRPLHDIVPLDNVHQVVQLIPKFGSRVPEGMTCDNSLEHGGEFYINSFADKETFHAILGYQ